MTNPTDSLQTCPVLVLSPHLDDAALSCGALLDRPEAISVVDVFTQRPEPAQKTEWDRMCGFSGSNQAMDARLAEEHQALASTPHHVQTLDLLDGQYLAGERADRDTEILCAAIDAWIADEQSEHRDQIPAVIAPVGAGLPRGAKSTLSIRLRARKAGTFAFGNSPDHLFVRDTAIAHLMDRDDVGLWLYEELPYRYALGGDRLIAPIEAWSRRRATRVELAVDRDAKAQRLAAYASQLPLLFRSTDAATLAKSLEPVEHYWHLAPQ